MNTQPLNKNLCDLNHQPIQYKEGYTEFDNFIQFINFIQFKYFILTQHAF